MDNIFKHVAEFCVVYIDDILVFSKNKEEHMKHLHEVVKLIVQHGIILGEKKIFFILDEVDFLGINIKNGVIKLQPHILEKIWKFPDKIPDAKSLERFLGVINYGRDFIPKISGLTAMLSPKTSSKRKWNFTEDDEKIVKQIKNLCKNLHPLQQPEENDEIILQTDASDNYWSGVVLAKAPGTNIEKICKFCSGKFSPAKLNYPTGEKEILAVKKTILNSLAFLGKPFTVRTDCARVKNFKIFKLDKAADRGRLANWQLFLNQYDYNVELIAGNKNYLPDALTREMAMFSQREDDEGRNPRSRRTGKEHELQEDPMETKEKVLKRFLLSPKGLASTDQSQGKGLASPSQTADGKGSSRPLTAAALPKNRPTPTGVINVFNYELRTFDTPVFRTGRRLAYHQKAILDNLLFAFQERSSGLMFPALFALAEELYENARPQFEESHIQQSAVRKEKILFLESPESARVPVMALNESDWHEFHSLIGRHNPEDLVPPTLFIVSGPYVGRYLVNVQSEHPQEHKLWLVENGFVHNLWTKTNDDLKGLPPIIVNTVKNVRKNDCMLRLKFRSTPPEWIQKANGEVEYIPPYHYVRIIQRKYLQPACVGYNGQPNSSIPWMKAMTLEYIKKIISEDTYNTFLAAGEKIIITAYDHPDVVSSDLFLSLTRKEIDSTLACLRWVEKLETDNHYKMYVDTDVEDNATTVRMAQADNDSFVLGHNSETDENM
ncbi:putative nucleotidyltransferase, Ribonuclease H [Rosa chinensis]|uniref:Putative nucleotidyltransferase, Ribonuclease H n=1 Tax=Rosa chinensis TaxID=74649 RepID=A0A2P6PIQ3_ROSCH|nr:putative nucleotidyltransferase, Ribonuclease H [Rosa chinensis]